VFPTADAASRGLGAQPSGTRILARQAVAGLVLAQLEAVAEDSVVTVGRPSTRTALVEILVATLAGLARNDSG
jgi:hypothetical protein